VSPLQAALNETQTFSVTGECMPSSLAFFIEECADRKRTYMSPDLARFSCTPTGLPGPRNGVVKNRPGGLELHHFSVDFQ
jgi:hypothetical protein